jgi:hypothetical protein
MNVDERARAASQQISRAIESAEVSARDPIRERFDRFRAAKERTRRVGTIAAVVVLLGAIMLGTMSMWTGSGPQTPGNTGTFPAPTPLGTLTITGSGCALDGAGAAAVGPYTLRVINETGGPESIAVFGIASDARFEQMLSFIDRVRPRFGDPSHGPGSAPAYERLVSSRYFTYARTNVTDIDGHASLVVPGDFDAGTYGIQCVGRSPERDSSARVIGPIDVEPNASG